MIQDTINAIVDDFNKGRPEFYIRAALNAFILIVLIYFVVPSFLFGSVISAERTEENRLVRIIFISLGLFSFSVQVWFTYFLFFA